MDVNVDAGGLGITMAAQWIFGNLVKRWPPLAGWPNKLVPIFNMGLGVLVSLGAAKVVTPAHASVGSSVAAVATNPLFQSWVAMVLTTAHHTVLKNTWQWLSGVLGRGAAA